MSSMLDASAQAARAAVLVSLDFGDAGYDREPSRRSRGWRERGRRRRARWSRGRRDRPDPALFAGNGKVEEIGAAPPRCDAAPA